MKRMAIFQQRHPEPLCSGPDLVEWEEYYNGPTCFKDKGMEKPKLSVHVIPTARWYGLWLGLEHQLSQYARHSL